MIHPTAIISPETRLGKGVMIGAYAVLEGVCVVGDDVEIMSHAWIRDTSIGIGSIVTPFAKIDASHIGHGCKVGCELRKCEFGDRVQASHTSIVLEKVTITGYANIGGGTVFAVRGGKKTDAGGYVKGILTMGSNIFVGMNVSFLPSSSGKLTIGDDVFIAANIQLRHSVPTGSAVYPRALCERFGLHKKYKVVKETESYLILAWNKMKEEGIMTGW